MPRLSGKVSIVTGGSASIGAAISRGLIEEGSKVVIAARSKDKGGALANELGEHAKFIQTDITDDASLDALLAQAKTTFGSIDILVNNACSYGDDGAATSRQTWLNTLNTNAVSAAILSEKARPHLKISSGTIVNIGSISGRFPHINRWAYPVSKAALAHLSKTQAVEYAADGIRVNLLMLGHIWSDPFEGLTGDNRAHADTVSEPYNLMGRVADASEVARAVVFLSSSDASYITGSEMPVDGGYSAMGPEQHYPLMPLLMEGAKP